LGKLGAIAHRAHPGRHARAASGIARGHELLLAFDNLTFDDEIVEAAVNEPDATLRSLDAIHLATARALGADLAGMVTYDDRLARAARDARIAVVDPRD
jgi:predicted nucleic acid-binding protein